jgi:hypothetical protein
MKIALSKERLEFVDGTPVNQHPVKINDRRNTCHLTQSHQTIQATRIDRDKLWNNSSNIYSIPAIGIVVTWQTLKMNSIE